MAGGVVADASLTNMAAWVIIVPFITGFLLLGLRGYEIKAKKKLHENLSGGIGVLGLAISWVISIIVAIQYFTDYVDLGGDHGEITKVQGDYLFLPSKGSPLKWGILLDPLSVIFLLALTTIATVIHFYATEYMHADPGYTRFFGTMNFFTGSMIGFVLASNLFMGFIFWELLGVSSYLLIGYFWHKPSASHAAKKAFLYNKVGDTSFLIGIALIFRLTYNLGHFTLDYVAIGEMIKSGELGYGDLALPALLIFGGAVGKSAQFPLFGWLPEAMEGPTPVSSLLHSSTMVKAGLFLIARVFFMSNMVDINLHVHFPFAGSPNFLTTGNVIAWIGTITALCGALIAVTATDIKKVLAFSTVSQLGYIGLAIGSGGLTAGFFHMISHATFKSLLFLCAGSVIHSVHSQEMKDMGGLRKYMPWTFYATLIGLLGLAGVPLMNGFWSKDAVLISLRDSNTIVAGEFLYWVAVFTAGVTAFYSSKLLILTFLGEGRYDKDHVHPSPTGMRMRISNTFLAILVVIESIWFTIGTLGSSDGLINFEYSLGTMLGVHGEEFAFKDAVPSTIAVLLGGSLAFAIYYWKIPSFVGMLHMSVTNTVDKVVRNRFGLDIVLYWFAESPVMAAGDALQYVDKEIIDAVFIDRVAAEGTVKAAGFSDDFDQGIIDGFIDWLGDRTRDIGYYLRGLQKGQTPIYARMMTAGLAILLLGLTINYWDTIV
ncbi:MAG: NADH-quinone oxidoreductase subunit 5 family protein [Candidatus Kariarchaeaceae archaeon]|jgi:NADH-quinone oxidoreductase subunit L